MLRRAQSTDIAIRVLLTVAVLLPYSRLLTFSVIYVTDAVFTSDIFNGELPGRVLAASLLRSGQWPVWSSALCSGLPLAGSPADPLSLLTFGLLPPAAALDAFVVALLLIAAHGTYSLACQLTADRAGALLAAIAFAGSGFFAAQLMHLGIIATVAWLPVGLLLLDRALPGPMFAAGAPGRQNLDLALYGLVLANQTLAGFPQTAYYCVLTYGAFGLFRIGRAWWSDGTRAHWPMAGRFAFASLLGVAAGSVVMLPLSALAGMSDRGLDLGYAWAAAWSYWPPDIMMFLAPSYAGDVATNTYLTPGFFWEDYGYLGLLPALLAAYGAVHKRRPASLVFIKVATVVAFLFVLGRYTPVYRFAYELIPGMSRFRGPTRFLFIVELGLALLGGIGLSRLREDCGRWLAPGSRLPAVGAVVICLVTVADLTFHQARRNPMVPADAWLAPPASVAVIRADGQEPRTFTPNRFELHTRAFGEARGWTDVAPYFRLRSALEPNLGGGLWNVASADCYSGVTPSWYVNVWGDHNRVDALIPRHSQVDVDAKLTTLDAAMPALLRTYGVTHVVSPFAVEGAGLTPVGGDLDARVYRVDGAARVRFVPNGIPVASDAAAEARLTAPGFDPSTEVLLHDVDPRSVPIVPAAGRSSPGYAVITSDRSTEVLVETEANAAGYVLLGDTFYPGWTADVDGIPAPIIRANISVRAVPVRGGRHRVRFTFRPTTFINGLAISVAALGALTTWAVAAAVAGRRTS